MKTVYVCTPLKQGKFFIQDIVHETSLVQDVFFYIPPSDPAKPKTLGAELNRKMLLLCDEVWVFGLAGNDCSWEIGFADGLNKPVKVFITETNKQLLQDWMLWTGPKVEIIDRRDEKC